MDVLPGGSSSSDRGSPDSRNAKKKRIRHSAQIVNQLEAYFKHYPKPTEAQRDQLSEDLGLGPDQIRFWFQNKRNQVKIKEDRAKTDTLKEENTRLLMENLALEELCKSIVCPKCDEAGQQGLERLRSENAFLKEEYRRMANIVAAFHGNSGV